MAKVSKTGGKWKVGGRTAGTREKANGTLIPGPGLASSRAVAVCPEGLRILATGKARGTRPEVPLLLVVCALREDRAGPPDPRVPPVAIVHCPFGVDGDVNGDGRRHGGATPYRPSGEPPTTGAPTPPPPRL